MFQDNEVGKHWKEVNLMKFARITDIHISEQIYTLIKSCYCAPLASYILIAWYICQNITLNDYEC